MKTKIISLLMLVTFGAFAASTYTTHYNLEKSADGDTNWGSAYRTTLNTIDSTMYSTASDIYNHIADPVAAHLASAISTTPGSVTCATSTNAQDFMECLDSAIAVIVGGTSMTTDTDQTVTGNKTFTQPIVGNLVGDVTGAVVGNVTGNLTGDVTGNIIGDVTGNVTGNLTGDVTGNVSGSSGSTTGNAATATALAANPTDCSVGYVANAIDASGNLSCVSAGTGDVVGPSSSVDAEIALFDSTTGKLIKRASGSGAVSVTSGVYSAGTLSLTNGGSAKALTAVNGGLLYTDADSMEITSAGTAGQAVVSGGAGAPIMQWGVVQSKSTTYSIANTDTVIMAATAGGAWTATLPTAVGIGGKEFKICKSDSSSNLLTLATTSSQTIGLDPTSIKLHRIGECVTVTSDGANWTINAPERYERGIINCDSSSAITSQSGSWISSVGNISSGTCAITVQTGIFSSAPSCTASQNGVDAGYLDDTFAVVSSATSITVGQRFITGGSATVTNTAGVDLNLICVGPR